MKKTPNGRRALLRIEVPELHLEKVALLFGQPTLDVVGEILDVKKEQRLIASALADVWAQVTLC